MTLRQALLANPVGGCLFVLWLWVCSYMGSMVLMLPSLMVLPWSPRLYRDWNDLAILSWLHLPVAMLELLFGVRFVLTMDPTVDTARERAMIILNHRTYFDWLFFWAVLSHRGGLAQHKIVLKAKPLRKVPGFSWAMQFGAFLFIQRKWEEDKKTFDRCLRVFANLPGYALKLLFFPEGTDFCGKSRLASDRFADTNGKPRYEQVLHPRTLGFAFCLDLLRDLRAVDAILDMTVGYVGTIPSAWNGLYKGQFPSEVHFHIRRIPLAELPQGTAELEEWCASAWSLKERRLREFYARRPQSFAGEEAGLVEPYAPGPTAMLRDGGAASPKYVTQELPRLRTLSILVLMFWFGLVSAVSYGLWYSSVVRCWAALYSLFCVVITAKARGIDGLERAMHAPSSPSSEKAK